MNNGHTMYLKSFLRIVMSPAINRVGIMGGRLSETGWMAFAYPVEPDDYPGFYDACTDLDRGTIRLLQRELERLGYEPVLGDKMHWRHPLHTTFLYHGLSEHEPDPEHR